MRTSLSSSISWWCFHWWKTQHRRNSSTPQNASIMWPTCCKPDWKSIRESSQHSIRLQGLSFDIYRYLSVQGDELIVLIFCPDEKLKEFADLIDYPVLLDPEHTREILMRGDPEHEIAPVGKNIFPSWSFGESLVTGVMSCRYHPQSKHHSIQSLWVYLLQIWEWNARGSVLSLWWHHSLPQDDSIEANQRATQSAIQSSTRCRHSDIDHDCQEENHR